MNKTHVSYDGFLQKIKQILMAPPIDAVFISYGRLVNPRGNYLNAPTVSLYQINGGFVAVLK